ncbi:MAG TPA: hypothetical protein VE130_16485 [Nitrososphaeraceae archaeon]|nr:hypothetical protein [Nitrososphaeraceae archaeon]
MTTAATTTRTAIIAISDIFRSAIQMYFALLPIKINGISYQKCYKIIKRAPKPNDITSDITREKMILAN